MNSQTLMGTIAVCALLLAAAPALAGLEEGEVAPAFTGKEYINTPEVSLKDLRGQVILYEIFRTW